MTEIKHYVLRCTTCNKVFAQCCKNFNAEPCELLEIVDGCATCHSKSASKVQVKTKAKVSAKTIQDFYGNEGCG